MLHGVELTVSRAARIPRACTLLGTAQRVYAHGERPSFTASACSETDNNRCARTARAGPQGCGGHGGCCGDGGGGWGPLRGVRPGGAWKPVPPWRGWGRGWFRGCRWSGARGSFHARDGRRWRSAGGGRVRSVDRWVHLNAKMCEVPSGVCLKRCSPEKASLLPAGRPFATVAYWCCVFLLPRSDGVLRPGYAAGGS